MCRLQNLVLRFFLQIAAGSGGGGGLQLPAPLTPMRYYTNGYRESSCQLLNGYFDLNLIPGAIVDSGYEIVSIYIYIQEENLRMNVN